MAKFRQKIDASQVEDLALIGSTLSEMAIFLNCMRSESRPALWQNHQKGQGVAHDFSKTNVNGPGFERGYYGPQVFVGAAE
jgi:hypothetical protein